MTTTAPQSTKSTIDTNPRGCKRSTITSIAALAGIATVNAAAMTTRFGLSSRLHFGLLVSSIAGSVALACYQGWRYRRHQTSLLERARTRQMEAGLFDVDTGTFGPKYVELGYNHEMAQSYHSHAPMTLMSAAFDYDRIARIHGAAAAEHLVQVLSQILKSALRGSDVICHYDLGEFVVLLPETDMRQAEIPRQRIARATEQWNMHTRVKYRLSARVGLGDCWEGLAVALRDARLVCSMTPVAPPFPETGYVPRPVAVN